MESSNIEQNEHCKFFLKRKNRYCRFKPKPNAEYCPEHSCIMGVHDDRKRIPCPLDPSHNCIEDELHKHLKKCNVTKIRQTLEKLPYFIKNVNKVNSSIEEGKSNTKRVRDLTSERLQNMIDKVIKLYKDTVSDIEKLYLEHHRVKGEIVGDSNEDLTASFGDQAVLRKEMMQQASLVGQLDALGFLSDKHCFVELGAGKGKLSHWIWKASQDCKDTSFLLVERSSVRYKADSTRKHEGVFQRIKIDIQDLCLGKVPALVDRGSVVVVGKHLCGGATDLGLCCAVNTLQSTNTVTTPYTHTTHTDQQRSENSDLNTSPVKSKSQPSDESKSLEENELMKTASSCSVMSPDQQDVSSTEQTIKLPCGIEDNCSQNSNDIASKTKREQSCKQPDVEPPTKQLRLEEEEEEANAERKLEGIMIALCCHHRCSWDTYVGQEYMKRHGIDEEEFDLLTRLSSWAVCARIRPKGKNPSKESTKDLSGNKSEVDTKGQQLASATDKTGKESDTEKAEHSVGDLIGSTCDASIHLRKQLSVAERESIGFKAKRILDMGRLEYLRMKNMDCFLREYIDDQTTPENIVLIAIPNTKKHEPS